jgi:hypothetical protein
MDEMNSEDGGNKFLINVGTHLKDYPASQRPKSTNYKKLY